MINMQKLPPKLVPFVSGDKSLKIWREEYFSVYPMLRMLLRDFKKILVFYLLSMKVSLLKTHFLIH